MLRPGDRFQSAQDFYATLQRCLAGLPPDRRLAEVEILDDHERRALAELGGLGRGQVRPPRLIREPCHRVVILSDGD